MRIALMNAGRGLLIQRLQGGPKVVLDSLTVGAAANFVPDPSQPNVAPSVVYTGGITQIAKTVVSQDEVIISAILPNNLNLDSVGNIMLRSNGQPFVWFVLRNVFGKKAVNNVKHFAGDLHYQSMVLQIPGIANLLDLTNNPDFYASARRYTNLEDLPEPILADSNEVLIDNTNFYYKKGPLHATKVNNQWWAAPTTKPLDDPEFGVIGGGRVGEGYA